MKSITIHALDKRLSDLISYEAKKRNLSLNKTIKLLLAKALHLSPNRKKTDFSDIHGIWSEEEFEEFTKNTESLDGFSEKEWQ